MGAVVVLGERDRVAGFALAGTRTVVAPDAAAVLRAWRDLLADTAVVVLTPAAASALGDVLAEPLHPDRPITVVMPEPAAPESGARSSGAPSRPGDQP
jgi:vacuolar-type H+-ATPase subunit F/Vma7